MEPVVALDASPAPSRPTKEGAPPRPPAERAMRRLLAVPDLERPARPASAERLFNVSMAISGVRCLLSYVILPVVLPAAGLAAGVGPYIGIPVGLVALVFDALGVRRFWLADHRWRWAATGVYLAVMLMVAALVVIDAVHLAR